MIYIIIFLLAYYFVSQYKKHKAQSDWEEIRRDSGIAQMRWAKEQDAKEAIWRRDVLPGLLAAEEEKKRRKRTPSTHIHLHKHEHLSIAHVDEVQLKQEIHLHGK